MVMAVATLTMINLIPTMDFSMVKIMHSIDGNGDYHVSLSGVGYHSSPGGGSGELYFDYILLGSIVMITKQNPK